jgi:hypothetical protein
VVIDLRQREAKKISERVNPFDRALRRPAESLGVAMGDRPSSPAISC